jgi:hypothetical protein
MLYIRRVASACLADNLNGVELACLIFKLMHHGLEFYLPHLQIQPDLIELGRD